MRFPLLDCFDQNRNAFGPILPRSDQSVFFSIYMCLYVYICICLCVSYRVVLCRTVSYCVVLCRAVSYWVVPCRTVSYCVVACRTVSYCVVLCRTVSVPYDTLYDTVRHVVRSRRVGPRRLARRPDASYSAFLTALPMYPLPFKQSPWGRGGRGGMAPGCSAVCSGRRLLAPPHLPLTPCPPGPSASHRLVPPPPPAWPTLIPPPPHTPFRSLGRLSQRSPRTVPVSLPRGGSARRRAMALAVGQGRPGGRPRPGGGGGSLLNGGGGGRGGLGVYVPETARRTLSFELWVRGGTHGA